MNTFNSAHIERVNEIRRQMSDGENDENNFKRHKKTARVEQQRTNASRELPTINAFILLTAEPEAAGSSKQTLQRERYHLSSSIIPNICEQNH